MLQLNLNYYDYHHYAVTNKIIRIEKLLYISIKLVKIEQQSEFIIIHFK